MKEEILTRTAKEYFDSGSDVFAKQRYNSAVVLYFKALVTFADLYLLQKTGKIPSSHANRFNMTKDSFPELYNLIDKDFPFYQDSYSKIMSKELAEVIKDDAKFMANKAGIELH